MERAIEVVERALRQWGAPLYVRKRIVHNTHVVADLEARGAVFVADLEEGPRWREGGVLRARRLPGGARRPGAAGCG